MEGSAKTCDARAACPCIFDYLESSRRVPRRPLMPDGHDLERSLDPVWHCLSQDKRPIAFLIGAGCPSAVKVAGVDGGEVALIPDVAGLTTRLVHELGADEEAGPLLTKLVEILKADLGRDPTLEDMLTWLRTAATIVGSDAVRGLAADDIDVLEARITERIASAVNVSVLTRRSHRLMHSRFGSAQRGGFTR